jgi:hypothetical protein
MEAVVAKAFKEIFIGNLYMALGLILIDLVADTMHIPILLFIVIASALLVLGAVFSFARGMDYLSTGITRFVCLLSRKPAGK